MQLKAGRGRTFYAVGGTWRALARIHIIQSGYPLRVMHGYSIPAADALDFARRLRRLVAANMLANIEAVADARRPLLAYAALVLEYIIRVAKPKTIVLAIRSLASSLQAYDPDAVRRADLRIAGAGEEPAPFARVTDMSTTLVTGAGGFTGSHLLDKLSLAACLWSRGIGRADHRCTRPRE